MKFEEASGQQRFGFIVTHPNLDHARVRRVITTEEYRIGLLENFDSVSLVIDRIDGKEITKESDINTIKEFIMKGNSFRLPDQSADNLTKGPGNTITIVLMKEAAGHSGPSKTPYKDIFPLKPK